MNNAFPFRILLSMFAMYLPILIVCLVAGVVIVLKWRQAASGSVWALLGFGLALFLCIAVPIVQSLLQYWAFQNGAQQARMWVFSAFGIVSALLHAVVYVLLLVAIFAGRTKSDAPLAPPLNVS